jgi:integrase
LLAIAAVPDLTQVQRQNMAWALRLVARLIKRPPEQIPAEPRLLARRIAELSPSAAGISNKTWANARSRLNKALALTRPMLPGRHRQPLSPSWAALHGQLFPRSQRIRVSRILHWLSDRGITLETVTESDLEAFAVELRNASLSARPEEIWRATAWAWNRAQRLIPDWPEITINIPKRRETYTLPWSAFEPSLKADVDRYLARLAGRDPLADLPFRPVRPETLACRERQLRTFASALVHRGHAPASLTSLAALVELDMVKDGLRFFLERNDNKTSVFIHNLASTLKTVARHHVGVDPSTLDHIVAVVKRLEVVTRGMTRKNRDRLRPFDDSANVQALIELPHRLMKEADSGKLKPHAAALLAQVAVAVEVLLMAPIRLRNLLDVEFDLNLIQIGPMLYLVLEEHEVKNHQALDFPLPPESADLIKHFRDKHRPRFAGPENRKLFPGRTGEAKSRSAFRQKLCKTVLRYTGLKMNPHLFRHARAKIHLDRHPGEYELVSTALGHRSVDTARNFYTGLEIAAAMRHFDEVILRLRSKPLEERP